MPNITRFLLQKISSTTHVFTKKRIISFAVLSLLLISMFYIGQMTAFPNTDEIVINPDYSFWKAFDIIVGKVSSTYYAVSGDTGESRSSGSNDDPVIQYAIDTLSAAGGGSVGVRAAAYSASVVLKNGVRLVIEKGATGITVSVNAGATCWLEDYNGGVKYFYSSGSLVWKENVVIGEFWWGSQNRTDVLAYPEQTASYIVFQDGSLTKMKNCTTGQIDASSTNASTVGNFALGNMTSGGTLLVKGYINLTASGVPWQVKYPNTRIIGEGAGSFWGSSGATTIEAKASDAIQIVPETYAGTGFYGPQIEGILFISDSSSGHGITSDTLPDTDYHLLFPEIGFCSFSNYATNGKYTINLKNTEAGYIHDNMLSNNGIAFTGALMHIYSTDYNVGHNIVVHNYFGITDGGSNAWCFLVEAGVKEDNSDLEGIRGMSFRDNLYYSGSNVEHGVKLNPVGAVVEGVDFYHDHFERVDLLISSEDNDQNMTDMVSVGGRTLFESGDATSRIFIDIEMGTKNTLISTCDFYSGDASNVAIRNNAWSATYPTKVFDCSFRGTWASPCISNAGEGSHTLQLRNNVGYVSEKSITATNTTTTTFVFNHGLVTTATYVWCSFNFTGWTSWRWTSTTTQVTITITGTLPASMKCYAKVEYVP